MHGFCILICLPNGLSYEPSAGTGTVAAIHSRWPRRGAGFTRFSHFGEAGFFRFYELRQ